jgi:membrane associated rhomboid family serine protease
MYGGVLVGVLPGQPGVSWQGHLFGAIGGVLAAWWIGQRDRGGRTAALK